MINKQIENGFIRRILVVDDKEDNVDLLEAMLTPEGYTIEKAYDGEEALYKVEENPPDLILLDVMMPKLDGYDVCKTLKTDEKNQFIPIVMVTALKDIEDRIKGIEAGADDFLSKPIDKQELLARTKSLLLIKRLHDELEETTKQLELELNERKKAEKALQKSKDELEIRVEERTYELKEAMILAQESERLKSSFIANMSHEIRTPLNSMLGFINLLKQAIGKRIEEDEKTYFKIIRQSGERLIKTVDSILNISLLEAEAFNVNPVAMDLVKVIDSLISDQFQQAEEKSLAMNFTTELPEAVIAADEYCINTSISNVINNAIIYTESGGIDITLSEEDNAIFLKVIDTGIGISEEFLEKIYEPFSQESTGIGRDYEGVGLGLTLSKKYLELNQAGIEIESVKNKGTTVTLTFIIEKSDNKTL